MGNERGARYRIRIRTLLVVIVIVALVVAVSVQQFRLVRLRDQLRQSNASIDAQRKALDQVTTILREYRDLIQRQKRER
jgi:hypothetical protein